MEFNIIDIDNSGKGSSENSILIIYTGGTFGMAYDEHDALIPFNFKEILKNIPVLDKFDIHFTVYASKVPIDSSNIEPEHWLSISRLIIEHYDRFTGFIILHGTDTMAYSASALSFLLRGIQKPVILTGAQIPIGAIRSDARENLITSIEIATATENEVPLVREVCICFNEVLLRGNRAVKIRSSEFGAFESLNYPILAKAGINIEYNMDAMLPVSKNPEFIAEPVFDQGVNILRAFPGMNVKILESFLDVEGLKGVVMESYGSGNITTQPWFLDCLGNAIEKGLVIINVSQCIGGKVDQGKYATSRTLREIGITSGRDITTEAALAKLMLLLGMKKNRNEIIKEFENSWAGEIT